MNASWFCELHRLTTTTDCPKCDNEQIAALEEPDMDPHLWPPITAATLLAGLEATRKADQKTRDDLAFGGAA